MLSSLSHLKDTQNELLSFRKVTPLRRSMIMTDHLYAYTCAIFFRRRLFAEGHHFDADLTALADGPWVCGVLSHGHRFALLHDYLSTFVFSGENCSLGEQAKREREAARAELSLWMRLAAPALRAYRHMEKLLAGGYSSRPVEYAIYPTENAEERQVFREERPSFRYPTA